ncbi:MAG TPA: Gmad2 immunoglobulin-like domain-containing protein [Verrucomicrobiae bacterium]|nr:Gmad2 immunoglobulin-like domain-containing protein [Verrucomicrobiae bacterium]
MRSTSLFIALATALALAGTGCASGAPPAPPPVANVQTSSTPPTPGADGTLTTKNGATDRLKVTVPAAGSKASQPLLIAGEARGWYFEGSFPVFVLNQNGVKIGSGIAEADGDWMTDGWVPFTGEIDYPPQPAGSRGSIVFQKDNPSGEPANDDSAELNITF